MGKKIIFYFLFLYYSIPASAQQWQYAGDTVACDFAAANPYISLNKYNEAYLFYRDMSNAPERSTVKKFNGTAWVPVGNHPTTGWVLQPCLAFDTMGLPYAAITDKNLTVKRFDGANWHTVGKDSFALGQATSISMKIAPNNTPYIAFRDIYYNSNISVMKFDGTNWVYVGQPGFSPNSSHQYNGAWQPSLAFDQVGTPYIAYIDITNGYRLSVMKFNGTNWVYVGTPNISASAGSPTLVIDSQGHPIVGYTDGNAQVKKFNGTSWGSLGQPSFALNTDYPFLAIDKNDGLYFVYAANQKANVMEYHGSNWTQCGNANFHPSAYFTTIAVDDYGKNLYVGLQDGRNRQDSLGGTYNIVSVMKLQRSAANISVKEANSFTFNVFPNPTASTVQINYNPKKENAAVLKITNVAGQLIYEESFIGPYNKEVDLSNYTKGIYFIEIRSSQNTARKKVLLD